VDESSSLSLDTRQLSEAGSIKTNVGAWESYKYGGRKPEALHEKAKLIIA
jgi:hypothetical protein